MELATLPKTKELYVIDTCSLVAMTEIYPHDVFPGVWEKVDELIDDGKIISVDDVYEELSSKDDDIYKWAGIRNHIFKELDDAIQESAIEILSTHSNLIDLKNKKSSADPFLIATARIHGGIVVTEEDFSGGHHSSKIPDVCRDYKMGCINLLDMLRLEGLKL
ncbi:MAG: DUF4411 family protein [Sedimenticola sp.]